MASGALPKKALFKGVFGKAYIGLHPYIPC